MIAREVEALAAIGNGADQNCLMRAEVIAGVGLRQLLPVVALYRDQIENGGGEAANGAALLRGHVARHRQSLEVNLRAHDGASEIEQYPSLQPLYSAGENQKIAVAGRACGRPVAVGMFV